jgi:hypothetical protein
LFGHWLGFFSAIIKKVVKLPQSYSCPLGYLSVPLGGYGLCFAWHRVCHSANGWMMMW